MVIADGCFLQIKSPDKSKTLDCDIPPKPTLDLSSAQGTRLSSLPSSYADLLSRTLVQSWTSISKGQANGLSPDTWLALEFECILRRGRPCQSGGWTSGSTCHAISAVVDCFYTAIILHQEPKQQLALNDARGLDL